MAFCSNCGTKLSDDSKFCQSCGKAIVAETRPLGSFTGGTSETNQSNQINNINQSSSANQSNVSQVAVVPSGTAPLIMGILGLCGGLIPIVKYFTGILSLIALFVGASQRKFLKEKGYPSGTATAGMVMGLIAVIMTILSIVIPAMVIGAAVNSMNRPSPTFVNYDPYAPPRTPSTPAVAEVRRQHSDIIGEWTGMYNLSNQGNAMMKITVDPGNISRALFEFYPLPGQTNILPGSFIMSVAFATNKFYFAGLEWIEQPSNYIMMNIDGEIIGDGNIFEGIFHNPGTFNTNVASFRIFKQTEDE